MQEAERDQKIWEHHWGIKRLDEGQQRIEADVENISRDMKKVKEQREGDRIEFAGLKSSLQAAAEATQKAADQAISARQFWLGVVVVCITLAGTLLGIHA